MSDRETEQSGSRRWTCFLDYYDKQTGIVRKTLAQCRTTFASEAFHDFRVGVKRLRAFADLIAWVNPRFDQTSLRKALKPLYRASGAVRDRQVRMELIRTQAPGLVAGLSEYYNHLKQQEMAARPAFMTVLARFDSEILVGARTAVFECISGLDDNLLLFRAEAMFQDLLDQILSDATNQEPGVEEYHRVRMLAKQTRYVLEVIRACESRSDTLGTLDTRLRDLHRALGIWRDRIVAADALERFRHDYPAASLRDEHAYAAYLNILYHESKTNLDLFPELINRLTASWDTFQSQSPTTTYPSES